jgi:hypothetical protein
LRSWLSTQWDNADFTILPTSKGNTTVVLHTSDYTEKVLAILDDPVYKKLSKDPTQSAEQKTVLLIKGSLLPEYVTELLQPYDSKPPRLYGLPKIHKVGFLLRPIISITGASTYRLTKYLASLLGPCLGNS